MKSALSAHDSSASQFLKYNAKTCHTLCHICGSRSSHHSEATPRRRSSLPIACRRRARRAPWPLARAKQACPGQKTLRGNSISRRTCTTLNVQQTCLHGRCASSHSGAGSPVFRRVERARTAPTHSPRARQRARALCCAYACALPVAPYRLPAQRTPRFAHAEALFDSVQASSHPRHVQ